jgi:hypothetical protein
VLGLRADARYAQKFRQLSKVLVAVIFDVLKKTHSYAPKRTSKMAAGNVRCASNGSALSPKRKPPFYGTAPRYGKRNGFSRVY